jgi:hypothetical protein
VEHEIVGGMGIVSKSLNIWKQNQDNIKQIPYKKKLPY